MQAGCGGYGDHVKAPVTDHPCCSSMTEVPDEIFADLTQTALTRYGFTIQPHRFAVTGLCSGCQ